MTNQPIRKDDAVGNTTRETRPTIKFNTLEQGFDWYMDNQVNRSISQYERSGYKIFSMGYRVTKNPEVMEMRVCVKVNTNDPFFDRQTNAETLVRLSLPGVREPRSYPTDDKNPDYVVVSFFCFSEKPFQPR